MAYFLTVPAGSDGDQFRLPGSNTPVSPMTDVGGVRLVASIIVEAVRQLGLTQGSNVTAVIKASDVILATSD